MAGEKGAVGAHQAVEVAGAASDQAIEFLEVGRQHRDRRDAVEGVVRRGAATGEDEERAADTGQPRPGHLAHEGAGIGGHLGTEEIAVARVEIRGHQRQLTGDERAAVAADQEDRAQLRHGVDDPFQPLVQARLLRPDLVVRHAARDLVDLGDGTLHGLEDLQRMLVENVERPLDLVIGDRVLMAIAEPRCEHEQHRRQHDRCNHH